MNRLANIIPEIWKNVINQYQNGTTILKNEKDLENLFLSACDTKLKNEVKNYLVDRQKVVFGKKLMFG